MTDKLNNVTKTRYVFFVIIALVGWIAMLINEVGLHYSTEDRKVVVSL